MRRPVRSQVSALYNTACVCDDPDSCGCGADIPTFGCQRCGKEDGTRTMSWFNTQMICGDCDEREHAHPDIGKAKAAELAALEKGDRDYPGIGLPDNLKGAPCVD